jgi:hypothetical protein
MEIMPTELSTLAGSRAKDVPCIADLSLFVIHPIPLVHSHNLQNATMFFSDCHAESFSFHHSKEKDTRNVQGE